MRRANSVRTAPRSGMACTPYSLSSGPTSWLVYTSCEPHFGQTPFRILSSLWVVAYFPTLINMYANPIKKSQYSDQQPVISIRKPQEQEPKITQNPHPKFHI